MEIKNTTLFLIGIILVILGSIIVIFDYPQIMHLENSGGESQIYGMEERIIHERLVLELAAGVAILGIGLAMVAGSMLDRFENIVRQ